METDIEIISLDDSVNVKLTPEQPGQRDIKDLGTQLREVCQYIWEDRQLRYFVVDGISYCSTCGRADDNIDGKGCDPMCIQGKLAKAMKDWDEFNGTPAPEVQVVPPSARSVPTLRPKA